jgi:hypothetical protein
VTVQQSFLAADPELGHAAVVLQTADAFAGIAEAVLRVCLHALSMPSNALAAILDDPDPLPNTLSSSHLQAISYSSEQSSMLILPNQCMWHTSRISMQTRWQPILGVKSVQQACAVHCRT